MRQVLLLNKYHGRKGCSRNTYQVLVLKRGTMVAGLAEIFDRLEMTVDPLYDCSEFSFPGKRKCVQSSSCRYDVRCQDQRHVPVPTLTYQACFWHSDQWPSLRSSQSPRREVLPFQPFFRSDCSIRIDPQGQTAPRSRSGVVRHSPSA